MTKEEQQSIKWVERFGIRLYDSELSKERRKPDRLVVERWHLNSQLVDRSYAIYSPIKKTWVVWLISSVGGRKKTGKWHHEGVAEAVLWIFSASAEFERERLLAAVGSLDQPCDLVAL